MEDEEERRDEHDSSRLRDVSVSVITFFFFFFLPSQIAVAEDFREFVRHPAGAEEGKDFFLFFFITTNTSQPKQTQSRVGRRESTLVIKKKIFSERQHTAQEEENEIESCSCSCLAPSIPTYFWSCPANWSVCVCVYSIVTDGADCVLDRGTRGAPGHPS